MQRLTYLATKESDNDIVEHIENQLQFQEPITKSILGYFQINPVVIVQPDSFPNVFERIINVLTQHPQSLQQLVLTALDPERVKINSAKQACISAKILKHCPKLLLFLLQRGNDAVVLFDFLKNVKNQTSLGYFNQIFDHQSEEFQNSVIKFFAGSSLILQVCFQKCYYQQVFMVILNSIIRSGEIGLIQFKKQIFLRFLSLSTNIKASQQIVQNIMDMMGLILQNIFTLKQSFLQMVFDSIPFQVIDQIGQTILNNYKDKPNTAQYLIRMISYIVNIYKAAKSRNNYKNIQCLEKTVINIIKVFQKLMIILKDKPIQLSNFPNGQFVPKVGLVRYYLFTLFKDILSLNQNIVIQNLQFNEDKHKIIQIYLCLNKWNNMIHYLVQQCAVLLLKYERIRQQKIKYTRCKDFLNFLIEQFKASQYFFLQTSSNSSYGNIYYIYNIARAVAVQLQNTSELRQVLKNFKPLQKFITADLQNFQLKMDGDLSNNSSYMIKSKHDSIKKLVRKMTTKDIEQAHVHSNSKKMMKEDEFTDYQNKRKKKAQDKLNSTF